MHSRWTRIFPSYREKRHHRITAHNRLESGGSSILGMTPEWVIDTSPREMVQYRQEYETRGEMGQKTREFPVHRVISIGLLLGIAAAFASAADSPLADAVMNKDKEAVTRLLGDRSGVNTPQKDGTTALHWAV